MTEDPLFPPPIGDLQHRASAAATSLLHHASGAAAPDLKHVALVRRVIVLAALGAAGVVVGLVVLLSLVASAALPWVIGVGLVAALVGVVVLGIHAGGHGLLVPLPVLVLAVIWVIMVTSGNGGTAGAWVLAALVFGSALAAAILILPALAYRHLPAQPVGGTPLIGASGVAVSPLAPTGIARVNNETWTAESLSGPLPAGAPVHVARVQGVRLLVWSEAGTIPGPETLGSNQQEKEEA
jgi:membrane-bound ClpP family serine protease